MSKVFKQEISETNVSSTCRVSRSLKPSFETVSVATSEDRAFNFYQCLYPAVGHDQADIVLNEVKYVQEKY